MSAPLPEVMVSVGGSVKASRVGTSEAKDFIRDQIFMRIEPLVAVQISKQELMAFVNKLVAEIANDRKILLKSGRAAPSRCKHR